MANFKRHALFWVILYVLWSYMKTSGSFYLPILMFNVLNVIIYMIAYYTLRHVQLPLLYNQGKVVSFVFSLLLMSLGFYIIWRVAGMYWLGDNSKKFFKLAFYLVQTVQFYSPAIALLAWESYHERQKEKVRIEQLEKEKIANELKFLKAQINPHFLFNTLNNLYSFVINQSPKAPDMIMRMSGMLDYILYQSQKSTVSLSQEVDCIENFLELEKIRYGDRLKVNYDTQGNMTAPISPLILLSLVENAFKHGASGDIDQPEIKIKIGAKEHIIDCLVWNTKSQFSGEINDAYKEGIGLSNIKRQLKITYPNLHQLDINDQDTFFEVSLTINANS